MRSMQWQIGMLGTVSADGMIMTYEINGEFL